MKKSMKGIFFLTLVAAIHNLVLFLSVVAQDKPADNMKILLDKVKADKKAARGGQHGTDRV